MNCPISPANPGRFFNIMQEGDVQIKGYPVRLPLDVEFWFFLPTRKTTPRAEKSSRP